MSKESMAWLGWALLAHEHGASIPWSVKTADEVMTALRKIGDQP